MATSSEKANLARIRDNQRRSRARRKEYLQELEAKLRGCELQGIEASAEIQGAARRVAEENKKLRELLVLNGIGDEAINAHLNTTSTMDTTMGGQYGSGGNAVQLLEGLLQSRKCCGAGNSQSIDEMGGARSRDSSVNTVQTSPWDIPQTSTHQFLTPSSSVSVTSGTSTSMGHGLNRGISKHQRIAQMPRNPSPVSTPTVQDSMYEDFTSQLQLQDFMSYDTSTIQDNTQIHMQPHSGHGRSPSYTTTSPGVNDCNYATAMITTMAGGDSDAIRADLGCLPDMDCEVDNHVVFNVMDRYMGGDKGV